MLCLVNHAGYEGGGVAEKMHTSNPKTLLTNEILYAMITTFITRINHRIKKNDCKK